MEIGVGGLEDVEDAGRILVELMGVLEREGGEEREELADVFFFVEVGLAERERSNGAEGGVEGVGEGTGEHVGEKGHGFEERRGGGVELEVGEENAFIFGMSSDEVINYEQNGGYHPMDIFNNDQDIRHVLMQLINGYYSPQDPELFRDIYDSLLNTNSSDRADTYVILKDFRSYAEAHKRVEEAYRDEKGWAKKAIWNTACSGKFSSDRTIQQYVDEIWHLDKMTVTLPKQ